MYIFELEQRSFVQLLSRMPHEFKQNDDKRALIIEKYYDQKAKWRRTKNTTLTSGNKRHYCF